ncbi:MAG: hypothetical protein LBQ54_09510 [Planctomycetaceae bacterium]|nr:hypothetical protein [Planctomycetaceae bacterium]
MERSDHEAIARRGFPAAVQRATLPLALVAGVNGQNNGMTGILWARG